MLIRFLALLCLALPLAHAGPQPLPPEQAFQASARRLDAGRVEVRWTVAEGYYLYRDKFRFAAETPGVTLGEARIPAGTMKDDPNFGPVEIYHRDVAIALPVSGAGGALALRLTAQGCADMGICYPPLTQTVTVQDAEATADAAGAEKTGGDETSRIARLLHGGFWIAMLTFFGFGLLLAFTPCVLPLVPILSGIIVNHGHAVTHARAFALSLAYVLGMAVTYALAGVAAGLSGTLLSSALQNGWVLGGFALVFVVLSLSMFGFYELQLPAGLQGRLSESANRRGGSMPALFVMGALSALIVGPCVAAPLAGALLYIARTGDAALGGAALFALALGMGAPLLAVGLFSRSLLPRTGPWMEAVKKFFGVVLLATALWLVSPVLPAWLSMLGWAALLIVPAIYLHALDPLPAHAGGWQRLWKGIGVAMLIGGAALLVGVLGGARDPLQPLGFLRSAAARSDTTAPRFERIASVAELDARLKAPGTPVMLDFYADWCVSCKEMERDTFSDPRVQARLAGMRVLQADVTANSEADRALLQRFGLFGPPGIVFFDANGAELTDRRVVGYLPPDAFLTALDALPRR